MYKNYFDDVKTELKEREEERIREENKNNDNESNENNDDNDNSGNFYIDQGEDNKEDFVGRY